ncbi:arylsulfatase [Amaricoccus solimangrovi]|uniref:Arylsulfatase n=1 Tax=Amaricoccus solimangrovi TaxID=2589815 RepID=A0A501WII3_9RHOB|nr:arylsulfatase [Amaricoccus solimangrovi]TPE46947.1 arylsulfatase [Amaricoccus solimangrovi]
MLRTLGLAATLAMSASGLALAQDAAQKPNILVIFGDDIGQTNLSIYSNGLMGYRTPNIDRIGTEGGAFTDYYAEQSCTAGRSTFITGQVTLRTGMSKVGLPGADVGLQESDATMASALKDLGYATGQFGKNHLGDRDEFLPTNHGFDEFFGNLYHLNAEEEPENFNYPTDPEFRKKFGPRGVIHSYADGRVEDTGPLTKKRMETIDDETSAAAIDFMKRQHDAGTPFFTWMNTTRMHFRTHVRPEHRSQPGLTAPTEYADGMVETDNVVGEILKSLDDMGIADDTIVIYTTDNGPHQNSWPDAGTTPFRSEKNTNWEGAYRVPALIRWPGHIEPGTWYNGIFSGLDWFPTLLAAAGNADITQQLLDGATIDGKEYKNHLDGYNQLDYLTGKTDTSARKEFFYFNDDNDIVGLRYENWKLVFEEQRETGHLAIWAEPFTKLRLPKIFDLRSDPYERADITSNTYYDWLLDRAYLVVPAQAYVANFLGTFKDYPPAQRAASFSLDQIEENLMNQLNATAAQ